MRHLFNTLGVACLQLTLVSLVFALPTVQICCVRGILVFAEDYRAGVEPGDWIEYELNWTIPPSLAYPTWIRREVLDVNETAITINITQQMSDGSVRSNKEKGDVLNGTGAAAMIFIPAHSETGDFINIEGFYPVRINGTVQRTYLGTERTVLWANFEDKGFKIHIFWDEEKGVALEINHSSSVGEATVRAVETNLFRSESPDNTLLGPGLLIFLVAIVMLAFVLRNRYLSSKRKKRRWTKKNDVSSFSEVRT